MTHAWIGTTPVERNTQERLGLASMVVAGTVVGLAIAADGLPARVLNGAGGLLWLGSFALNAWSVRRSPRRLGSLTAVFGTALVLAVRVKPHDPLLAMVGFGVAGALVAGVGSRPAMTWSLLIPGLWLPLHLSIAIGRAVVRSATEGTATVRTEPPPTAAIVPLVMVVAAVAGGWIVRRALDSGVEHSTSARSGSGAD